MLKNLIVFQLFLLTGETYSQLRVDTVCVGSVNSYQVNDRNIASTYTWKLNGVLQNIITNEITIQWSSAGLFALSVQEHSKGCDGDLQSIFIYVKDNIIPLRYPIINVSAGIDTKLRARKFTDVDNFKWNPQVGLNNYSTDTPIFNYNRTTEYTIAINSQKGCAVVDTVLINVIPGNRGSPLIDVIVPTAFTPNGDQLNDKLFPTCFNIKQLNYFKVFNRWGMLLYETTIRGEGWDGRFRKIPQPEGIYVWIVEAIGIDSRRIVKTGSALLVR